MIYLKICQNTQEIAKKIIDNGETLDFECVLSEEMTKGKTTKENIYWSSPKGNLYVTIIKYNDRKTKNNIITNIIALNVIEFIKEEYKIDNIKIKWPNDFMIEDFKIGGILLEEYKNYYLIGFALNLISHPEITENYKASNLSLYLKEEIYFNVKDIAEKIYLKFKNIVIHKKPNLEEYIVNKINNSLYKKNETVLMKDLYSKDLKKLKIIGININSELICENENRNIKNYSIYEIRYKE